MKVIIAGGGITGLSTAIALQKKGIECRVFEKTPEFNVAGAGITMAPMPCMYSDNLVWKRILKLPELH